MPADGRINIAGLNQANLIRFVDGVLPHLPGYRGSSLSDLSTPQELSA
jgi:aromatic-amino-acid transaminase